MGYILDLTLMLDKLFWVEFARKTPGQPLSVGDIEDAFNNYKGSEEHRKGHHQIREYVDSTPFKQHLSSNNAHQEVVRLIKLYCDFDIGNVIIRLSLVHPSKADICSGQKCYT
jgi:hypothetical protein